MRYAIYKQSTGEILRVVGCAPEQLPLHARSGEAGVEMPEGDDTTHYILAGVPVPYPAQPDPAAQFDYAAGEWFDPRTLDGLKAAKWEEVKAERQSRDFGGFLCDGSRFDSDTVSQSRIQGAVIMAMRNPAFNVEWRLADNTLRTLSATDMLAVGDALLLHVGTQFAISNGLRAAIESVDPTSPTAKADVMNVAWPQTQQT